MIELEKEKPIILKLKDFESKLITLVNEANLPAFLLVNVVNDLYRELLLLKSNEIEVATREYYEKELELPKVRD